MLDILIITSRRPRREDAASIIHDACSEALTRSNETGKVENILNVRTTAGSIQERISLADIVVADVSGSRQDVMYELGFAHASGKPTILVSDETGKPVLYDLAMLYVHLYPKTGQCMAFYERLVQEMVKVFDEPRRFTWTGQTGDESRPSSPTVFVSYSRADGECLERLRVHLKPLDRANLINYWDDQLIQAGDDWQEQIGAALNKAKMAVLLISADFLASDFVVESELPSLLTAAESEGTTILPVVLKPCGFFRDEQLSRFQCVNDPRQPLISLSEAEQEEVYARIADRVANELRDTN